MMQELNYIHCGDYYIPDIRLPEENRPIGRWGRKSLFNFDTTRVEVLSSCNFAPTN